MPNGSEAADLCFSDILADPTRRGGPESEGAALVWMPAGGEHWRSRQNAVRPLTRPDGIKRPSSESLQRDTLELAGDRRLGAFDDRYDPGTSLQHRGCQRYAKRYCWSGNTVVLAGAYHHPNCFTSSTRSLVQQCKQRTHPRRRDRRLVIAVPPQARLARPMPRLGVVSDGCCVCSLVPASWPS
jgi:hypothetical protein